MVLLESDFRHSDDRLDLWHSGCKINVPNCGLKIQLLFGIRVRCDITMIELRKRLEHPRRRSLVQKEWEGFSESQEKAFQTRKRNTISVVSERMGDPANEKTGEE